MSKPVELQDLMNVGPSIAEDLRSLGVGNVKELAKRNPDKLYVDLCEKTRSRQDPCVLDTFRAAVDQARGKPATPWWEYSRKRKAGKLPPVP